MYRPLATALVVLGLSAGAAMAQSAPPPAPTDSQPAPAVASGPPSVDWPIQDLLANPGAKAVLDKDLPGLEGDPRLDMVKTMSLRAVAQFPEAQIDQTKLDSIQADLTALPKPAT